MVVLQPSKLTAWVRIPVGAYVRFYVAGKLEKKDLILEVHKKLRAKGHDVSYDWTAHKPIKPYHENKDLAKIYSANELQGIASADVVIFLTEDKGHTLHMEGGAALMSKKLTGMPKRVIFIGEHNATSPWHFNEHAERYGTVDEVLNLF